MGGKKGHGYIEFNKAKQKWKRKEKTADKTRTGVTARAIAVAATDL